MSDVSRVRDLLAKAVQCLDAQSSASSSSVSPRQPGSARSSDLSSSSVSGSQPGPSGKSSSSLSARQSDRWSSLLSDSISRQSVRPSTSSSSARQSAGPSFTGFRAGSSIADMSSRASALAERNCLFNFTGRSKRKGGTNFTSKSKKKVNMWVHEVICLAKTDRDKTPTAMETASLISSGLGNKKLSFLQYGDSDDTHFTILEAFPQLRDAGGYEVLRANQSRILEVVPAPADGYTTAYLKDIFGQAKVYLRPIQRDLADSLDDSPISHSTGPKEKCLNCGSDITLTDMRNHMETCKSQEENSADCVLVDEHDEKGWDSDFDDFELPQVNVSKSRKKDTPSESQQVSDVDTERVETETAMMEYAMSASQEECSPDPTTTEEPPFQPQSLKDVITHLLQFWKPELQEFQVRREHILDDLFQETKKTRFHPLKRVQTWFIGELGRDTGGITRELWRLLGQSLMKLCEGRPATLVFRRDPERVVSGEFKRIGILVGMSLMNGGSGFPYFAPAMYSYISGQDVCNIVTTVEEVPNAELKAVLVKLIDAKDDEVGTVAMEACDILIESGCSKGLAQLKQCDVPQLVKNAALGCTVLRIKAELDQFMAGLDEAGVLHIIQKYPDLLRPMFVASETDLLCAEFLLKLLAKKVFSESGSISLVKEQSTYVFFRNLLDEVEDGLLEVNLGDILSFFTGANRIPPLGFADATLNFNPFNPYPTASTCGLCLTLPTKYDKYDAFKLYFLF